MKYAIIPHANNTDGGVSVASCVPQISESESRWREHDQGSKQTATGSVIA